MCLILFACDSHPDYSLIFAANRDEYYSRSAVALGFWEDAPDILAGRDLEAKGTWLGMTRNGRLCALTNFRGTTPPLRDPPSRGNLVRDFLAGTATPKDYLEGVKANGHRYNGFNLLAADGSGLHHYSNKGDAVSRFGPGVYGISNCSLGTPWPKIVKGKEGLTRMTSGEGPLTIEGLLNLLEDRSFPPPDTAFPDGPDREMERVLSPLFIEGDVYGTRSSSVILMKRTGEVTFAERTFVHQGEGSAEGQTRAFEFTLPGQGVS